MTIKDYKALKAHLIQSNPANTQIIKNWNAYGLKPIKSENDFIELLCLLDYMSESLDSLHDVGSGLNSRSYFGGIVGTFCNDSDIVNSIFNFYQIEAQQAVINSIINESLTLSDDPGAVCDWFDSIVYDWRDYIPGYSVRMIEC